MRTEKSGSECLFCEHEWSTVIWDTRADKQWNLVSRFPCNSQFSNFDKARALYRGQNVHLGILAGMGINGIHITGSFLFEYSQVAPTARCGQAMPLSSFSASSSARNGHSGNWPACGPRLLGLRWSWLAHAAVAWPCANLRLCRPATHCRRVQPLDPPFYISPFLHRQCSVVYTSTRRSSR